MDVRALTDGLRLLIDTNLFVALEPYAGRMEPGIVPAARLVRLATEQRHVLLVHPATTDDLNQGKDDGRRLQQLAELRKFPTVAEVPVPAALVAAAGDSRQGSNDHRDLRILAALYNHAADYLVTDDVRLRKRARRAGVGERVLTLAAAVEQLEQLAPSVHAPPPRVERIEAYALDGDQPIFASLRADYPDFDGWLRDRVRPDHANRDCLVVTDGGRYAALAIVKRVEQDCPYPLERPVSKLATLKVDEESHGSKYGELLLKAVFADAHERAAGSLYVEVFERHDLLVDTLRLFGFVVLAEASPRGELVLAKRLRPPDATPGGDHPDALGHHLAFGPPAVLGTAGVRIVPIRPGWHDQLFPDAPSYQQSLPGMDPASSTHPWGNALRKAYLSNSKSNVLRPGDTLLFYRSHDDGSVTTVGVVEDTLRSASPAEVMAFVGARTVYTRPDIERMCSRVGGVLAVLFRQDRFVDPPWSKAELQQNGVFRKWPQSIARVPERGAGWVNARLAG